MLLAIAILSGIGFLLSIMNNMYKNGEFDADTIHTVVLVLSTWQLCLPISIIVICLVVVMVLDKLGS